MTEISGKKSINLILTVMPVMNVYVQILNTFSEAELTHRKTDLSFCDYKLIANQLNIVFMTSAWARNSESQKDMSVFYLLILLYNCFILKYIEQYSPERHCLLELGVNTFS